MKRPGTGFFRRVIALGPAAGTAAVTAAVAAASLALSVAVMAALGRLTLFGMAVSVAVPLLLVPVSWYPFIRVSALLDEAEARLRASERKHRSILANMREAYVEVDRAGRIAFFNDALARISGYAREELAGRPVAALLPRGTLRRMRDAAVRQLERGGGELDEFAIRARDGSTRVLEASLSPTDAPGEAGGFRAVLRDVTERQAAARERADYEERLRRARKMESIGLLAGGVAHDLNNVLSGLVGYPDILLHDHPDDPALRAGLTTIRESGERAAGIVQDLLTLARRGLTTAEALDLNRLVAGQLRSPEHGRLVRDHPAVRFAADLGAPLPAVEGSAVHLGKALANVLLNAFEATAAGGSVTLATAARRVGRPLCAYEQVPPGDYVAVTVADTGTGMTAEDRERVFEPFYTRKKLGRSGTGLGMAVVWGVVKDHGGFVDIRPTPGGGTTVELLLPASREEVPVPEPPEAIARYRGRGERVLLVDDETDQREIGAGMLRRLGYEAVAVASGPQAVERLRAVAADIVLLDMLMDPGPDGLDTSRMIREIRPGVPILITSGYAETDRVREAIALGGVAYLRKPFRMEALARAVRDLLGGAGAREPDPPAAPG